MPPTSETTGTQTTPNKHWPLFYHVNDSPKNNDQISFKKDKSGLWQWLL